MILYYPFRLLVSPTAMFPISLVFVSSFPSEPPIVSELSNFSEIVLRFQSGKIGIVYLIEVNH